MVSIYSKPVTIKSLSYRNALLQSMSNALSQHSHVIIMGQGVDDHKGTFGSTLGLAEKYGKMRVFDIPLSEEGNTGMAVGAALNGVYPIQTHIRTDFSLLAMSQIVNMAAKYKYMYGGHFNVPMLIRLIIGRSWGQGAQHSQSLQSLFAHIPGLQVIMPSNAYSIMSSYDYAVNHYKGPVISFEHRILYDIEFNENVVYDADPFNSKKVREGSDVTIVATSIMVIEALRAADYVQKTLNLNCEIIDLHSVSHMDKKLILDSVKKTGKLFVADTSWQAYGVAAEISRLICEEDPSILKAAVVSIGMQPAPCPTTQSLEKLFYPSIYDFISKLTFLITGKTHIPDENKISEGYKKFKGPF
ncbi:MAG TPA: transketolase C-terminal domain-containing protein [Puia sp.]|jgi:pyruvate/2-oxoglutarate/acetoin dehydrogenase E1 component|nr:transketolase C-terminal domain-containing protein [Puia sp.]